MKLEAGVTYRTSDGDTTVLQQSNAVGLLVCPKTGYLYDVGGDDESGRVYPGTKRDSPRDILGPDTVQSESTETLV